MSDDNRIQVVNDFADAMQFKIDKNSHKDGWESDPIRKRDWTRCSKGFLVAKLMEEVGELCAEYLAEDPDIEKVSFEAADVGNLAMMIADNCKANFNPNS